MDAMKRLSRVFESAKEIPFSDSSRFILMSDCHRGDGSWADDFAALTHYYANNYTYIEIGDGDELWENNKLFDIIQTHSDVFWLLTRFHEKGRLYLIYGNHDIEMRDGGFIRKNCCRHHFVQEEPSYLNLYENIRHREALILKHTETGGKIFLVHGHQADFANSELWRFTKFTARYLWRPLELFGANDPTSAAKNVRKMKSTGKKLAEWSKIENQMLVAGHTHKPVFPKVREAPYFNDGSCVHPRCITGIEIANGSIVLVKWSIKAKKDGGLYVGRDIMEGPRKLADYL